MRREHGQCRPQNLIYTQYFSSYEDRLASFLAAAGVEVRNRTPRVVSAWQTKAKGQRLDEIVQISNEHVAGLASDDVMPRGDLRRACPYRKIAG